MVVSTLIQKDPPIAHMVEYTTVLKIVPSLNSPHSFAHGLGHDCVLRQSNSPRREYEFQHHHAFNIAFKTRRVTFKTHKFIYFI